MLVASSCIIAVILYILRPAVQSVETNRQLISSLFLHVPKTLARTSVADSEERLRILMTLEGHDEDDTEGHREIEELIENAVSLPSGSENSLSDDDDISDSDEKVESRFKSRSKGAKSRKGHKSRCPSLRMLGPMSLVFMVGIVYFILIYFIAFQDMEPALLNSPAEVNWANHRSFSTRRLLLLLRALATPNATVLSVNPEDVELQINTLERQHHVLTYGETQLNLLGNVWTESGQDSILFTTACIQGSDTLCPTFGNGIMRSGLHAVMLDYIDLSRIALSKLIRLCGLDAANAANSGHCYNATTQIEAMKIPEMELLDQMERRYLHAALLESEKLITAGLRTQKFDSFRVNISLMSGAAVVVGLIIWIRFYTPYTTKLNAEVRRTRSMLLLLPSNITTHAPFIGHFLKRHIKKF